MPLRKAPADFVPPPVIAYYRVSTAKQGRSRLGLEAQEAAVAAYVRSSESKLLAPPYVEIESGRKSDRPKLAAAVAHARRARATLVIAKLDRLSRNVAFLANLMEAGVDFVACDNPHANRLTVHILAAVAEDEARAISERTTAALAAAKTRGTTLAGRPWAEAKANSNLTREGTLRGSAAGVAAIREAKAEYYREILPIIADLADQRRPDGSLPSFRAIAQRLNAIGEKTRRGSDWTAVQVSRVLRAAESDALDRLKSLPVEDPRQVGARREFDESADQLERINRTSNAEADAML